MIVHNDITTYCLPRCADQRELLVLAVYIDFDSELRACWSIGYLLHICTK